MTILAVEDFIKAFTNQGAILPWRDRVLLHVLLMPRVNKGKLLSQKQFDWIWNRLSDKGSGVAAIQRSGFWSVPTKELCARIAEHGAVYGQEHEILEIGAGRGLFVAGLSSLGVKVKGIDDASWAPANSPVQAAAHLIERNSAQLALKQIKPKFVLSVWPPPGNSFERAIFATESVNIYFAIVSRHRFASGNWQDYQAQTSFTCTTSEPLNQMLRPIEGDQQLLIFRRKTKI